ncbi:MAG: DUF5915 domain-containing protein, partial [Patescibacteria group bacterium]
IHTGQWSSKVYSVAPGDISVSLRFDINDALRQEGEARELVRDIQMLRKEKGCTMDAKIGVILPTTAKSLTKDLLEEIQRKTLAKGWGTRGRQTLAPGAICCRSRALLG